MLEGDVAPLPMAGIFEFATQADALSFYQSPEYAPIKVERDAAQEARMFVVDVGWDFETVTVIVRRQTGPAPFAILPADGCP